MKYLFIIFIFVCANGYSQYADLDSLTNSQFYVLDTSSIYNGKISADKRLGKFYFDIMTYSGSDTTTVTTKYETKAQFRARLKSELRKHKDDLLTIQAIEEAIKKRILEIKLIVDTYIKN